MSHELVDALYDAVLTGDKDAADAIRARLATINGARQATITPEQKLVIPNPIHSDTSTPLAMLEWCDKVFGQDWTGWEFETIEQVLFNEYGTVLLPTHRDRLWALKIAATSDMAMHDWYLFNQMCLALCGVGADFVTMRVPDPGMVVFTAALLSTLHPESEFDEEVIKYMCSYFLSVGICLPPPSLSSLLSIPMKWFVSKQTQMLWPDIYSVYRSEIANPEHEIADENTVDIQADRIIKAELAAKHYAQD